MERLHKVILGAVVLVSVVLFIVVVFDSRGVFLSPLPSDRYAEESERDSRTQPFPYGEPWADIFSGSIPADPSCEGEGCPWPAESLSEAINLGYLGDEASPSGFDCDLSGAVWNPVSEELWLVRNGGCDGESDAVQSGIFRLARMESGDFEVIGSWLGFGDIEGVTQVDFDKEEVYIIQENSGRVRKYDLSSGSAILKRDWSLGSFLPGYAGGSGPEGITFVPDEFLEDQGFVNEEADLYTSQNGMGGLMFVGHQNGGRIYVFDLNPDANTFDFVGAYKTGYTETAGLEFDRSTGMLYVFHGANYNHLEVVSLESVSIGAERKLVTLFDYDKPGSGNLEGIAVVDNEECVGGKRDFFITVDDGWNIALKQFKEFECWAA